MALEEYLKIHSDGSLLLVAADSFLLVATRPEPKMYIDRLTITYGDIDNELPERK